MIRSCFFSHFFFSVLLLFNLIFSIIISSILWLFSLFIESNDKTSLIIVHNCRLIFTHHFIDVYIILHAWCIRENATIFVKCDWKWNRFYSICDQKADHNIKIKRKRVFLCAWCSRYYYFTFFFHSCFCCCFSSHWRSIKNWCIFLT